MIELPETLNPFRKDYNIRIHVKMLSALPLGNVKSITAFHMLQESSSDKTKIIESSSGNTAASLGVLGQYFGFNETQAYVSHEVSSGKLKMLQLFNVKPLVNKEPICPSEGDITNGIHKARKKGLQSDWFNPDQYANPNNLDAHYQITGPQIWDQAEGIIDYFCTGLGTTGTMVGTSRFLKEQNPNVQIIGIVRSPNNPIPGPRTENLLEDISFPWNAHCDGLVEIGTVKAYEMSLKMIRLGLLAGPSSGMNLAGVQQFIQTKIDQGDFQKNQQEMNFVLPCCDQPFPYMDDYFKILPKESFPAIENQHLLQFVENKIKAVKQKETVSISSMALAELTSNEEDKIVDIRSRQQFQHAHIPNAVNIPMDEFISEIENYSEIYEGKKLYFVCDFGKKSAALCRIAAGRNFNAVSLEGGFSEWSELDLPRIKDLSCTLRYGLSA